MHARIEWQGKVQFKAESGSGHTIQLDGPPDAGGVNAGARPMELVLMGLGGCTSYDVVNILTKSRQNVRSCVTELTADRAESTRDRHSLFRPSDYPVKNLHSQP